MEESLAAGGVVLILGSLSLWVAGPPGMFACGLALVIAGTVGGSTTDAAANDGPEDRMNCSECGAVNNHQDEHCHYCGAELGSPNGAHDRQ